MASPTAPVPLPGADLATAALAALARAELASLAYPDRAWVPPAFGPSGQVVHDVLVVGGGQSGLGLCAALRAQGVRNVLVVDRAPSGQEGVWDTFARMPELRTPKALNGLDLGLPALSVQRWYTARFGEGAWSAIDRIPRTAWMDYLRWYRATLQLPVENDCEVTDVRQGLRSTDGDGRLLAVDTVRHGQRQTRLARLVVLATGTDGAGAWRVPAFIADALPADRRHHSSDPIDFGAMRGRRVAILGHGASAFDNAVAALRAGAATVDLCFRRAALPRVNPHRHIETAGLMTHYARLGDTTRWQVARHFRRVDQPPPRGSFHLALSMPGFAMHAGCGWNAVQWTGSEVAIDTPRGRLLADHVICATGQQFDLAARPELRTLGPAVARWSDRYTPPASEADANLGAHPYLGEHYEFRPRRAGGDDWVERVFAFNSASFVSHGPHSTSISGHKHALPRLVRGLTQRLFLDQEASLVDELRRYDETDLVLPPGFEAAVAQPQRFAPTEVAA